ncbi:hypothetical protein Pfo_008088 [Paulownia fortunei]|nr:hypothetical protein Pfo_008088 [Paulownia fortunei]
MDEVTFRKKQLKIAKDVHRVDVLCYRIFLSYRLLDGTSRFKEIHKLITDLKAELEIELGPLNDAAAKMSLGHASRLQAASRAKTMQTCPSLNTRLEQKSNQTLDLRFLDTGKSPSVVLDKEKEHLECFWSADTRKCNGVSDVQPETLPQERLPTSSSKFDLNTTPVPTLNEELRQSDATNRSQFIKDNRSGGLDDNFENIVQTICKEFRLKFLPWFSLRYREH